MSPYLRAWSNISVASATFDMSIEGLMSQLSDSRFWLFTKAVAFIPYLASNFHTYSSPSERSTSTMLKSPCPSLNDSENIASASFSAGLMSLIERRSICHVLLYRVKIPTTSTGSCSKLCVNAGAQYETAAADTLK